MLRDHRRAGDRATAQLQRVGPARQHHDNRRRCSSRPGRNLLRPSVDPQRPLRGRRRVGPRDGLQNCPGRCAHLVLEAGRAEARRQVFCGRGGCGARQRRSARAPAGNTAGAMVPLQSAAGPALAARGRRAAAASAARSRRVGGETLPE